MSEAGDESEILIERFEDDRQVLLPLLLLADDSPTLIARYIDQGEVVVARCGEQTLGVLLMVEIETGVIEIKNMAIAESHQGQGLGRRLVDAAVALATERRHQQMVVATGLADVGNVRFYQRVGFRGRNIVRDVFTSANGYPDDLVVNGVPLRDQIWFDRMLEPSAG